MARTSTSHVAPKSAVVDVEAIANRVQSILDELLHARHRDALAIRVAEKYGLAASQRLQQLEIPAEAAAQITRLDQKVASIMSKWNFANE